MKTFRYFSLGIFFGFFIAYGIYKRTNVHRGEIPSEVLIVKSLSNYKDEYHKLHVIRYSVNSRDFIDVSLTNDNPIWRIRLGNMTLYCQ